MKKEIIIYILLIVALILLYGCQTTKPVEHEVVGNINDIKRFFPQMPFTWEYSGSGEYYQRMQLEDIKKIEDRYVYKVQGEVNTDARDEKYQEYRFTIRYVLTKEGIIQEKIEKKMLDSKYDQMYLLKFPIEKGNTWKENVIDSQGNQRQIESTIEAINFVNNKKEVVIKTSEFGSNYYEKRWLREGLGVYKFEKQIVYKDNEFVVGYTLNRVTDNKMDSVIVNRMENFLVDYNYAWEKYFNRKDEKVFEYIDKSSKFYELIQQFSVSELKIKFIDLEVISINKNDEKYVVKVLETYQKTKGEQVVSGETKVEYILQKTEERFIIISSKNLN